MGCSAIEAVADDRGVQSEGVCSVDAQLVRAAGQGEEIHEPTAVRPLLPRPKTSDGRFAVFDADYLSGSVLRIRQQRQVDCSLVRQGCVGLWHDDGLVALQNITPLEIGLEPFVHLFVFCQHQ